MNPAKQKLTVLVLALFAVVSGGVSAHDTDIYVNNKSGTTAADPLVMISIDTRPNTGSSSCTSSTSSSDPCNFLRVDSTYTYPGTTTVVTFPPYLPSTGSISQFDLLKAVLKYVLDRTQGIKVGLMAAHDDGTNCTGFGANKCSNGGYILAGFQPLTARTGFNEKLDALAPASTGSQSHPYQGREMFFELFRYLTGQGIYNGHNGWKDYATNNTTNMDDPSDGAYTRRWDPAIESGTNYTSPLAGNCVKIYTVNIMFAVTNQDADSDNDIKAAKSSGGLGVNTNTVYSMYTQGFAQIARWLYETDLGDGTWGTVGNLSGTQNVTSFFVTADSNTKTQEYASAGVGLNSGAQPYVLSDDPKEVANKLKDAFDKVLSVSTTFTAPAVAVNTFNRSQILNDVYIAMFQADADKRPFWNGNIKKFTLGSDFTTLLDANGVNAVSATDGRIENSALSFWTDPATLPAANTNIGEVTGKDGRSVARGGCGQRTPGYVAQTVSATNPSGNTTLTSARKLFTEPTTYTNGTSTALMPLEANTATATALFSPTNYFGATTTTAGSCDPTTDSDGNSACNLIKFARGYSQKYDTVTGVTSTTPNNWMFGDPLHSRPMAINYGAVNGHSTSNPDVRILVGSNDGFVRMIRNTSSSGTQEGIEAWAFMPREAMPNLSTLKTNTIGSGIHPIGVDGTPSVYVYDANLDGNVDPATDKVYAFIGMRRGGYSYYALDLTNPDDPKILWKITKGAAGTDFAELGQTWSTPRTGKMIFDGVTPVPVLIFAGGYDTNKDTHPPHVTTRTVGTNDSQGNAIFIVNLQTGALVWKAIKGTAAGYGSASKAYTHPGLVDSIPSDVTAVDSDNNGLIDRIYVGDTGGVLWRVDLKCSRPSGVNLDASNNPTPGCGTSTTPKPWALVPILSVGRHYNSTLADDRRFFYAPDYVQTVDGSGVIYDGLPIGTGDREDPNNIDTVNYFYMFKDLDTQTGVLTNYTTNGTVTHSQMAEITSCTPATPCSPFPALTYGWRLKLECPATNFSAVCGEKNLSPAITVGGVSYFSTFTPGADSTASPCALSEGIGTLYGVALQDGAPVGISGTTTLDKLGRIDKLKSGGIPAEIVQLGNNKYLRPDLQTSQQDVLSGIKTYWYKKSVK